MWILFGGTFINRFGTFVMPFLVIYMTRNGYSPAQAGLAVSAYGSGHLLASLLGGHLADAIGRRHTIALSMFCSAAAMVALSQARGIVAILAVSAIAGVSAELYRPAAGALLGDLVAPEQRVTAFAMYRLAINLGFAVGPATAGFLADRSFLYIFLGDAATSTLYGIITLTLLPHGLRNQTRDESAMTGVRVALRDRVFVRFLIATLCITWIEFQTHSTVPLYIVDQGFTASTYGALMSINGAMIVLFELVIIAWTQRLAPQPVIAFGYALSAIGFALTGLAHSVPMLAMTVVVWTLGEMIYAPVTGAFVTTIAPERYRGRYQGLWMLTWSIGMLLGPALGTLVYERYQPALWIACAVTGVIAAVLALGGPSRAKAAAIRADR
ncbi:MAG TPA: MFS transporter [Thermoanaerobaculia bacterium]|nr:MFS transporter [Thermoanaerobaculia bacterium]